MWKVKLQQQKDFDLYRSCMVLAGIKAIRTAAGLMVSICFYGQCKPNPALQIFSAPAFRSLMTQHLLLHYPVPQPCAKGRGWQKVILMLPPSKGHLSKTRRNSKQEERPGLGEMWHIVEGILVFTGSQTVPARKTAPTGSSV